MRNFTALLLIICVYSLSYSQDSELIVNGKKLFLIHCSRCHGVLGNGGTGPSLTRPYLPRGATDEILAGVIKNGIPDTGMPFNWMLSDADVELLVEYVRHLGEGSDEVISGDPEHGQVLFNGSICSTCHIISGKGGSVGPELTQIGLKRGPRYMSEAITHPGKTKPVDQNGFYKFMVVQITLNNGETLEGVRLNEDTFTIQLKDAKNQFHSFKKSDIKSLKKIREESLMPGFADQFNESEINDLVAYLSTLK